MSEDARTKTRKEAFFLVQLHCHGAGPIACHARNISVGGMLLEIGRPHQVKGFRVELSIHLDARHFEIPAVIKRRDNHTLAVMFCKPQPELFRIVAKNKSYAHMTVSSRVM